MFIAAVIVIIGVGIIICFYIVINIVVRCIIVIVTIGRIIGIVIVIISADRIIVVIVAGIRLLSVIVIIGIGRSFFIIVVNLEIQIVIYLVNFTVLLIKSITYNPAIEIGADIDRCVRCNNSTAQQISVDAAVIGTEIENYFSERSVPVAVSVAEIHVVNPVGSNVYYNLHALVVRQKRVDILLMALKIIRMNIDNKSFSGLRSAVLDSPYGGFKPVYLCLGVISRILITHQAVACIGNIMKRSAKVGKCHAALSSYKAYINVSILNQIRYAVCDKALLISVILCYFFKAEIKDQGIMSPGRRFNF